MTSRPAGPRRLVLVLGLCALGLGACTSARPFVGPEFREWEAEVPPPRDSLAYRVFLVGETADEGDPATLRLLRGKLAEAGANSAVVFLGDQLRRGLPDSLSAEYAEAEAALWRVLGVIEGYDGRVIVIPGDGDARGVDALDRQADFLRAHLGDGVFLPPSGLAGPVDVRLADGIVLFALDTGWWLRDPEDRETGEVEGEAGEAEVESELDVLLALDALLLEYKDDRILVVGHHPVFANGERGGHFGLRQQQWMVEQAQVGGVGRQRLIAALRRLRDGERVRQIILRHATGYGRRRCGARQTRRRFLRHCSGLCCSRRHHLRGSNGRESGNRVRSGSRRRSGAGQLIKCRNLRAGKRARKVVHGPTGIE